jgi:hypothetical protein
MAQTLDIEVIARAILRGQKTVNFKGNKLSLPAGQSAGTETQKLVYARLKAKEVLSNENN